MKVPGFLLWMMGGLLLGVSFVFGALYWCFIPAFVLLLFALEKERSFLRIFLFGTLAGALHYAGSFVWVWNTYPVEWMAGQGMAVQFAAIGLYWTVTSLIMGIGLGVFAVAAKPLLKNAAVLLLCGPFLWLLSELLKSLLYSVYTLGPGSTISSAFGFGYIGYLLAQHHALLQLSALAGVYGLSVIAAFIGIASYLYFARILYKSFSVTAGLCVLLLLASLYPWKEVREYTQIGKDVAVIETSMGKVFKAEDKNEIKKNQLIKDAAGFALQENADYLVFPEDTALSESFESADDLFSWVNEQTNDNDLVLVDNKVTEDARSEEVVRTYLYDTETRLVYFMDKNFLVAQGEYLSYVYQWLLSLFTSEEGMNSILKHAKVRTGVITDSPALPGHLPGVLFCFETVVPYSVKNALQYRNPAFIAHSISHTWFDDPFSLEYQLDAMLQVHAVWNNVPIVTAGAMAQSKLYMPTGEILFGETMRETPYWSVKKFEL